MSKTKRRSDASCENKKDVRSLLSEYANILKRLREAASRATDDPQEGAALKHLLWELPDWAPTLVVREEMSSVDRDDLLMLATQAWGHRSDCRCCYCQASEELAKRGIASAS